MADERIDVLKNVSMKRYTSIKVGGIVPYLFYPVDGEDLSRAVAHARQKGLPFRFFGNGTNIIVSDKGVKMTLIRITRFGHVQFLKTGDGALVEASGGISLKKLIRESADKGLSGIEKLYGIPGTVGGAVKMNAGSFGVTISDCLESVTFLDSAGQLQKIEKKDAIFGYRTSSFQDTECILSATFRLSNADRRQIEADVERVWQERLTKHPMDLPSAGSVFKNTGEKPCWHYIEQAGFRGYRIGDACISEKHPNFIVNMGHASASDIKLLIESVKEGVQKKTGVELKEEVELWGFDE